MTIPIERMEQAIEQFRKLGLASQRLADIPAIAIYDDEFFENFDYDIIAPDTRYRVSIGLLALNYQQVRASRFKHPDGTGIVFPKPNFTLSSNPIEEMTKHMTQPQSIVLVTPTQLLIWLFQKEQDLLCKLSHEELDRFAYQLPSNIAKISQIARQEGFFEIWERFRDRLLDQQKAGIQRKRAARKKRNP